MKDINKPRDYMVYAITDTTDGRKYVGFTSCSMSTRRAVTKYEARKKAKDGSPLYHSAIYIAAREHPDKLTWEVLEEFHSDRDYAGEREVYWIAKLNTMFPNGLNQKEGGRRGKHRVMNITRPNRTRKKFNSWANQTPEQIAARREAIKRGMKGLVRTPEHKANITKARKAQWENKTPEEKEAWQKKATAARVNTPMSAEGRARIAAAQKARWERIHNENDKGAKD